MEELGCWKLGYYACAAVLCCFLVANWANLPSNPSRIELSSLLSIFTGIDWVGVFIASAGLGLVSYTCAYVLNPSLRC